ncbi:hypothetical protein Droror1_Dr00013792 [Drosera rotundifolia]
MIQLLFVVLLAEAIVLFLMLVKIGPLSELVINSLDQVMMGKGRATVKTIAGTMSVILLSSLISILKIRNKGAKLGTVSPMDQVLWRTHLHEASLMGRILLLQSDLSMAVKNHCNLRIGIVSLGSWSTGCTILSRNLSSSEAPSAHQKREIDRLQKEKQQLKEKDEKASKQHKLLQEEVLKLTENTKKLSLELKHKVKTVETTEAHVAAPQKQAEYLLLEYDRLLEDNQNLRNKF